jgi:cytochrome P450
VIASPPVSGPPGTLIGGNLAEFNRDKLGSFSAVREYGDAVLVRLGPVRTLLLNHPDAIEDVLVTHNHSFRKHRGLHEHPLARQGLLTSEGDFWLRQRR